MYGNFLPEDHSVFSLLPRPTFTLQAVQALREEKRLKLVFNNTVKNAPATLRVGEEAVICSKQMEGWSMRVMVIDS